MSDGIIILINDQQKSCLGIEENNDYIEYCIQIALIAIWYDDKVTEEHTLVAFSSLGN